ncbi:hypothetical protein KX844_30720, partial [Pseudomonas aeruginosa]|uniref:hypothetical protein n=2 Tax=Pseudomonas aeruginosa TaxID=287 RepID=UPI001C529720
IDLTRRAFRSCLDAEVGAGGKHKARRVKSIIRQRLFDQQLTTAPRFEILTTSKQYRLDTPDTSGGNRSGESAKEIQKCVFPATSVIRA